MATMIDSVSSLYFPFLRIATISLVIVVCVAVGKRLFRRSLYKGIPGPPSSYLGFLLEMHHPNAFDWHFDMPTKYGHVAKLQGGLIAGADALYISDPMALHTILVKDQNIFRTSNEFSGLFGIVHHGDGVASVWGKEHKRQRKLMNPVFTAAHVSKLAPLFYNIAYQLKDKLASEFRRPDAEVKLDVLDSLTRTALELISQGGIGHTFRSFDQDSKDFNEFHDALKGVLPSAARLFLVLPFLESWRKIEPVWLRRFLSHMINYLPWPAAREFKKAVDTMHPVCADVFQEKKRALDEGGIEELSKMISGGKDLTTQLMHANAEADEEDRMTDEIVVTTMSSIILGGQETTSGALSRLLSLMALDPALQARLREEIHAAKKKVGGRDLDYNELNELPYLDAVIRETLRMFAPVTFVWRRTMEDTVVPLQFPMRDPKTGAETKELLVHKDTSVYLGLGSTNRSPAIWGPDAAVFNPERWLGKTSVESTVGSVKNPGIYSNLMTFSGGGRSCPGMKFAVLEIKLVLSVLIPAFSFAKSTEQVDWRMGLTIAPYIRGREDEGPKVPIKLRLLQES